MKIKEFQDGSYLEYAAGNFDQWCVYMVNPSKNFRRPPLDVDYFGFLREQAKIFGSQKIYDDFVSIYNLTSNQIERTVLDYIGKISVAGYGEKKSGATELYKLNDFRGVNRLSSIREAYRNKRFGATMK